MDQPTPPRLGTCERCQASFVAGKAGPIASRCPDCRKARPACRGCGGELPLVVRGGSRGGPIVAGYYCSDDCKPRCSIDGCGQPARKRGWCANHYSTWHAHGKADAPVKYRWATERLCLTCGLGGDSPAWESQYRKWCSATCYTTWRKYGGDVPESVTCAICGAEVPLALPPGAGRKRRRADTAFCDRHARHGRVGVTARQLAEETGAWCRLCGDPVDLSLHSPDRLSATVDHIVPRALGGPDDRSNLQLAHRGCNSSKRHRFVG